MQWKPHGNPRLHPDEEAALGGQSPGEDIPTAADTLLDDPQDIPVNASPEAAQTVPIYQRPSRPQRFDPGALGAPNLGPPATTADYQQVIQALRAEEAKPPHQRNEAAIARLKAELQRSMGQEEALWVQSAADRLLPRLES